MLDGQRGFIGDAFRDRILVEVAELVLRAEDLERAFALRVIRDWRARETDNRGVRRRSHEIAAEVLRHRTVRLVNEHEDIRPGAAVLPDRLELVDHRDDEPTEVPIQQLLQLRLRVRTGHGDVLLLHFAEQALYPTFELAFKLGSIDDQHYRSVVEPGLVLEDQPRRGQQRECLARPLRVPDEATGLLRVRAPLDDRLDRPSLVLSEDRLSRLAVLHIEQDPLLERSQELGRLEETLHCELVGFLWPLLPPCHIPPIGVPRHAVPVVEQVRDVEQLGRGDQFWCLLLIPP